MKSPSVYSGVWSAAPTPFTRHMDIDLPSLKRSVVHHLRLGIKGLFLAGTCGEGPWMTDRQRQILFEKAAHYAKGALVLAAQVTDNSAPRILDNIRQARNAGMDIAVVAPPYFLPNATPQRILALYRDVVQNSPLPVGIYDRGIHSSVVVPNDVLKKIYAEPSVVLIKDSSADFERMKIALAAKRRRPQLALLNGWEFNCVPYLQAGYDGLLLGGGIFNGHMAAKIMDAVRAGDLPSAQRMQAQMNRIMYAVFGGQKLSCWLSGQKKLLVEMGIFSTWNSYLNYPLTSSCRRAIERIATNETALLMPWRKTRG